MAVCFVRSALIAVALAGVSRAEEGMNDEVKSMMLELDQDGDGKVSKEEFRAMVAREEGDSADEIMENMEPHFVASDADGDAVLDHAELASLIEAFSDSSEGDEEATEAEEVEAGHEQEHEDEELDDGEETQSSIEEQAKKALLELDKDGDGKVSKAELRASASGDSSESSDAFMAQLEPHFVASDADGDALLDQAELAALMQSFAADSEEAEEGESEDAKDADAQDVEAVEEQVEGEEPSLEDQAREVLMEFDTDGDGKVSAEELRASMPRDQSDETDKMLAKLEPHFAASDADGDALLDHAELAVLMQRFGDDSEEGQEADQEQHQA